MLLGTGAGVWAVFAGWRELMINRSQFLAGMIDRSADRGGYVDGMLIGLDALPDEKSASLRQRALPLETSAENALDGAWHKWSSSWGERRLLTGHTGGVTAVAFSPNGARVLTGSFDMTAPLWPMFSSAQALVEEVKASAPRCLTPTQREAHNLGTPPPRWCYARKLWPFAYAEPPPESWDARLAAAWDRATGGSAKRARGTEQPQ